MKFSVEWVPAAEEQLAAIWLAAGSRELVRAASERIDDSLATEPLAFGESRENDTARVGFCRPLAIRFDVYQDKHHVVVSAVWTTRSAADK